MPKKLVLFDVDGTLLTVGETHKATFAKAFKKILQKTFDIKKWEHSGYTDLQIIHEFMDKNKIEKNPEVIAEIISYMIEEFSKKNLDHSIILPGVEKLLKELKKDKNIIVGLLTGNIEEIAYTKLKHFNIDEYFVLGSFGHTTTVRAELVDYAIKETERKYGKVEKDNTFLIGDTPRDIAAARKAGVKIISVATGNFPYEELKHLKTDYLFKDLKETEKILEAIRNDKTD